jgi:hypothetical protein
MDIDRCIIYPWANLLTGKASDMAVCRFYLMLGKTLANSACGSAVAIVDQR